MSTQEQLRKAAVEYAEMGLPIFWGELGKKFSTVFKRSDALASVDMAKLLWTVPGNILLATGQVVDVVDVDDPKLLKVLEVQGFYPHVKSPRGFHFYFLSDPEQQNQSARGFPMPKVDYLSDKWHTLMPPSMSQYGEYRWIQPLVLSELQSINVTGIPQKLRTDRAARKKSPMLVGTWTNPLSDEAARAQIRKISERWAETPNGNRNGFLYWAACLLSEKVLSGEFSQLHYLEALDALRGAAEVNGYEQDHRGHVEKVFHSAYETVCRQNGVAADGKR